MCTGCGMVGKPVEELDTPALLVDLSHLECNIARTMSLLREHGVNWRPHAKVHKVPAIAHMEIRAGAIGIACAKLEEAEVMVAAGIQDILIANQVVGPRKATRLANLCRQAMVMVAVDCLGNVLELDGAARDKDLRIPVVVEVDIGMERCGVQPGEAALDLSRRVHDCQGLRYMGLMAWEGHARKIVDAELRRAACEASVGLLAETAQLCIQAGLPVEVVSCGGTGTERFSSRVEGVTEIQAGGIIFNDEYYSSLGLDHDFALTVLSTVISRPTATRIVTDTGRKAMSADRKAPRPIGLAHVASISLAAEHGRIELSIPDTEPRVGERVEWVVGYADTTVCLHDTIYGTRKGIVEVAWPIAARGKLQ